MQLPPAATRATLDRSVFACYEPRVSREHVPALDGVRGIAILAVFLFHCSLRLSRPWGLAGGWGWMGVDLFFVLSGFLITGILLDTRASASRFYFGGFYGRRVLRIAPAFLALMAALTVAPALTGQNATAHGVFIQHETWYWTFLANGHRLFTVEPNHGEVDRISRNGKIERVVDVSASQGHIVPTSIAHHGVFYLANLGTFPVTPGTEKLFQLTPHGQLHLRLTGLTAVTSLAFDHKHRLYALETSGCPTASCPGPVPGTGRVVRIDDNGRLVPIVTGLTTPTGMAFGPDGKLYISNNGYGAPPGAGEIVRVEVPKE